MVSDLGLSEPASERDCRLWFGVQYRRAGQVQGFPALRHPERPAPGDAVRDWLVCWLEDCGAAGGIRTGVIPRRETPFACTAAMTPLAWYVGSASRHLPVPFRYLLCRRMARFAVDQTCDRPLEPVEPQVMIEAAQVRLEIQPGAAEVRAHDIFNPVQLPVQHRHAYEDDRAQPDEQAGSADTITRDASRFAHAYIHMALPRAEVFSLGP